MTAHVKKFLLSISCRVLHFEEHSKSLQNLNPAAIQSRIFTNQKDRLEKSVQIIDGGVDFVF